ncbi:MAG: PIN domain-containing protein [Coleofasciculaceae cyanobacterium RL_1_1]|nr:PIN domain-containing protein [Coleofasciculaceae cyanobacterium RL_1_1]
MSVIVDTCIWSIALRRQNTSTSISHSLSRLIEANEIVMLGAIRQEILSGIRNPAQFEKLRDRLRRFTDVRVTLQDYELAAEYFNLCRRKGVQGSNTDFLICAVSSRLGVTIWTMDRDFENFQQYLPIELEKF